MLVIAASLITAIIAWNAGKHLTYLQCLKAAEKKADRLIEEEIRSLSAELSRNYCIRMLYREREWEAEKRVLMLENMRAIVSVHNHYKEQIKHFSDLSLQSNVKQFSLGVLSGIQQAIHSRN